MMLKVLTIAVVVMALVVGGCQGPARVGNEEALVWLVPGIEGVDWLFLGAKRSFVDAGVTGTIKTHTWKYPLGTVLNLADYDANLAAAQTIADDIAAHRRAHADAPIDIVGYSAGGGLAVMVLEALPKDVQVRNAVLVQPAVGRTRYLDDALRRVDGEIINYYSPNDVFFLGLGTTAFGTVERDFDVAAGKDGFDADAAVSAPALRGKLTQQQWTLDMMKQLHFSGHLEITSYAWNRDYVAQHLLP